MNKLEKRDANGRYENFVSRLLAALGREGKMDWEAGWVGGGGGEGGRRGKSVAVYFAVERFRVLCQCI